MGLWSNIFSFFSGASRRVVGIQSTEPSSGRMTLRSITPDNALQLSSVFACVRLLAETIAGLPFNFYKIKEDGGRELASDHYLYRLFHIKPNRYQTRTEFWETVIMQLAMHGNAYCKIERSGNKITSLLPLMSPQVRVEFAQDGSIIYQYNFGDNVAIYAEKSIWHLKLFGNGLVGLAPLNYARNSIGIAISAEERVSALANSGFKPAGVLMIDKILTPEQRAKMKEKFSDLAEGGEDSLRILEAGMKYEQISMNPKDVQFLESRRFQVEDIARFFGVPSVLINDTSATTVWGSGIQQIISGFYKLGLRPYMERIEASVTGNLLEQSERWTIQPEFDFDELLRGDTKTRYETYNIAVQSGVKTINECRSEEGLLPKDGGDEIHFSKSGGTNENTNANNK